MRVKTLLTSVVAAGILFGGSFVANASPGGTDDKGGHVCHTNCAEWGLQDGQYHIHPKVQFNGQTMTFEDVSPVILNDTTLVPLRAIFEKLGATVQWDEATQSIFATKGAKSVKLWVGKDEALVDGKSTTLVLAPKTIGGRTMVPLRFVSEALGADVTFNSATNIISIQTTEQTAPVPTAPPVVQQPTPVPPTTQGNKQINSLQEFQSYIMNNFGVIHGSKDYHLESFLSNMEGAQHFLFADIDPMDYLSYIQNYNDTDKAAFEAWGTSVVQEYKKIFPNQDFGLGVFYNDDYSFYPKSFDIKDVKYSNGKWHVSHMILFGSSGSSLNIVKAMM